MTLWIKGFVKNVGIFGINIRVYVYIHKHEIPHHVQVGAHTHTQKERSIYRLVTQLKYIRTHSA